MRAACCSFRWRPVIGAGPRGGAGESGPFLARYGLTPSDLGYMRGPTRVHGRVSSVARREALAGRGDGRGDGPARMPRAARRRRTPAPSSDRADRARGSVRTRTPYTAYVGVHPGRPVRGAGLAGCASCQRGAAITWRCATGWCARVEIRLEDTSSGAGCSFACGFAAHLRRRT